MVGCECFRACIAKASQRRLIVLQPGEAPQAAARKERLFFCKFFSRSLPAERGNKLFTITVKRSPMNKPGPACAAFNSSLFSAFDDGSTDEIAHCVLLRVAHSLDGRTGA